MANAFYDFLQAQPVLLLFLVLGAGYIIGSIKVFGISLGAVGRVLLAGLVFGHFGFTLYAGMQSFGFVLFIFCVGYQAGPKFFDVLMTSGLKFLSLALVVAATGFALAIGLAKVLGLAPGLELRQFRRANRGFDDGRCFRVATSARRADDARQEQGQLTTRNGSAHQTPPAM